MEQLKIVGGVPLKGEIEVSGAKNAALAILAAAVLNEGQCVVDNVPDVLDIRTLLRGIEDLGASVSYCRGRVKIDAGSIKRPVADRDYMHKIRGSYYLLGALLGRFKEAEVVMPGGCAIGSRPIDQHIKGFEALGCQIVVEHGMIRAKAIDKQLIGTNIYLDVASVGATINIMMAACLAKGQTTIENPAKEPHVVDVANFLNSMGANVKGAGTDMIRIEGVERLSPSQYAIIPDQIEAGTYMVAAAITGGDLLIKNLIPKHMEAISAKLQEMAVQVEEYDDAIRVYVNQPLKGCNVKTLFYPGFPTDMQPQFTALMSVVNGTSVMTESVFVSRFQYTDELRRMGADIKVEANTAIVKGVDELTGAEVKAKDLRAGAALVLAGLAANGESIIHHLEYIDRGYEHIEHKLSACGARIIRMSEGKEKGHLQLV